MTERISQARVLGALAQSTLEVAEVAHGQRTSATPALIASIFTQDASTLEDMLPPVSTTHAGLTALLGAFSGQVGNREAARYSIELLQLCTMLRGNQHVTDTLRRLLSETPAHQQNAERAAEIYQKTISTLGRRIQVNGDPQALQSVDVAAMIRSLLLCGIRFAWLWHQVGGRRWHLITARRAYADAIQSLLSQDRS